MEGGGRLSSLQRFAEVDSVENVAVQAADLPDKITKLSEEDNAAMLGCLRRELAFNQMMCYTNPEVGLTTAKIKE
eukprot:632-Prorocentrum_minimum.AAC.1